MSAARRPQGTRPTRRARRRSPEAAIGWREWVGLPDLGVARVKAKVDTGARSSSLHAFDVRRFRRRGVSMVRFQVHPEQRSTRGAVEAEAPVLERRVVRDSGGKATVRPVVRTTLALGGQRWPIDLTLASRDQMGFRMLLGREAVRGRFVVDPQRSFLAGAPEDGAPVRRNKAAKAAKAPRSARKGGGQGA